MAKGEGGVLKKDKKKFILPEKELETLEERGKIVREAPELERFITPTEARRQMRLEALEQTEKAKKLTEAQKLVTKELPPETKEAIEKKALVEPEGFEETIKTMFTGDLAEVTGEKIKMGEAPITPAGAAIRALPAGKSLFTRAREALIALDKKVEFQVLGRYTIRLKEMIAGGFTVSQATMWRLMSNINSEATALGTERNEKIARWMISGLHPDLAIQMYEQDKETLIEARETVRLYKIFYLGNYITRDVRRIMQNIQNQIDGKYSRIAEAEKFKSGITTADLQKLYMEEDLANDEEI